MNRVVEIGGDVDLRAVKIILVEKWVIELFLIHMDGDVSIVMGGGGKFDSKKGRDWAKEWWFDGGTDLRWN